VLKRPEQNCLPKAFELRPVVIHQVSSILFNHRRKRRRRKKRIESKNTIQSPSFYKPIEPDEEKKNGSQFLRLFVRPIEKK